MAGRGYGGIGLGGGAISGIVIGSFFGACLVAALVYWFIARPILAKHGGSDWARPKSFYDGKKTWSVKGRQWPSFYDRKRVDRSAGIAAGGGGNVGEKV